MSRLSISAIPGIPLIKPGDNLAAIVIGALDARGWVLREYDVLVVAQKVASKAESRYVDLSSVSPSKAAIDLAACVNKDPRLVELILSESDEVVKHRPGLLVTAHKTGVVLANAGIDQSNVDATAGEEPVLLLPEDPDGICVELKTRIDKHFSTNIGVVMSDSIGRAWRNGTIGTALGAAGLPTLLDLRGDRDLFGRVLEVSEVGFADQIASAAALVMGEGAEGSPAVLVQGLSWDQPASSAQALLRAKLTDMFR